MVPEMKGRELLLLDCSAVQDSPFTLDRLPPSDTPTVLLRSSTCCGVRVLLQEQHSDANFGRLGSFALNSSNTSAALCENPSTSVKASIPEVPLPARFPSVGRVGSYALETALKFCAPSSPQPPSLQKLQITTLGWFLSRLTMAP